MERNEITAITLIVKNVKGEKEGKIYDFLVFETNICGQKFTFYPKAEDKKILTYIIKKEYLKEE